MSALRNFLNFLLSRSRKPWFEALIFLAYLLMLCATLWEHEPWFDESHAWLMSRELSFKELFWEVLRYEGHPGLWYLLLYITTSLGAPLAALKIVSGLSALTGVLLLLRMKPVPLIVRCSLPFTFFIGYQYSVVARSYTLIFPILCGILYIWPKRSTHTVRFYLLMFLLSHVSVHSALIAISLMSYHFILTVFRWQKFQQRKAFIACNLLMALNYILMFFQLLPPADCIIYSQTHFSLERLVVDSWGYLQNCLTAEIFSSVAILAISAYWFRQQGLLWLSFLIIAPILAFFHFKFSSWHEGVLFLAFIFMWLLFFRTYNYSTRSLWKRFSQITPILLIVIFQSKWLSNSIYQDINSPYSGSLELAEYIKNNKLEESKIFAANNFSVESILPYFDNCLYANWDQKRCFWLWSTKSPIDTSQRWIEENNPEYIIASHKYCNADCILNLYPGYRIEKTFRGSILWKGIGNENDYFALLIRNN